MSVCLRRKASIEVPGLCPTPPRPTPPRMLRVRLALPHRVFLPLFSSSQDLQCGLSGVWDLGPERQ